MKTLTILSSLILALTACGKEEVKPTAKETTKEAPSVAAKKEAPKALPAPTPKADDGADYARVLISHKEKKPTDPVIVNFPGIKVVKADFDPSNLEGASAEVSLDLLSLSSGIPKRDGHLKSEDYLDVAATPEILIKVSDVKKSGDNYEATAEVSAHGATASYPVKFKVLSSDDTSVVVEATHTFKRTDFNIGLGEDDKSAEELTMEMRLTFKKEA